MLTLSSLIRISTVACLLGLGALSACGGKQLGGIPGGPEGGTGGSAGSSGGGGGGGGCVDVVLSTYDTSCNVASDCVTITSGMLCSGSCRCGGSAINVSGLAQYDSETSGLGTSTCFCPAEGVPQCIGGACTVCGPGSTDPSCGTVISDGGIAPYEASTYEASTYEGGIYEGGVSEVGTGPFDGSTGVCVDIVLSTYDQTCKTAADCIGITSGTLCPGSCDCGGSTINKDGQARYDAAISGIMFGACPCPAPFPPTCKSGMCAP